MIHVKDHKTKNIYDPWEFLGPKRRKLLHDSWAGLFHDEILNELPVGKLAGCYCSNNGRNTKELYTALGTLILQQMNDMPDDETIENLAFNMQWHYALDITDESDAAKYMCPRTLWGLRDLVVAHELDKDLFEIIADKLVRVFNVDTDKQRLDSVHTRSNMKRLGRIGILTRTIHKFLVNLKRHHRDHFDNLPEELAERYISKKALSVFSMVKPSESKKKLLDVSRDLYELVERFSENECVKTMTSYDLLCRVLSEQCEVTKGEDGESVEVRPVPPKDIPSDSLQNPSDTDSGYSAHKGQGYETQVMETYKERTEKTKPNLITYAEANPAYISDAGELIPAVENTRERGLGPDAVLADSLYGSDENCQSLEKDGVEVVSPVMGIAEKNEAKLSDFEYSKEGEVLSCPEGFVPLKTSRRKDRRTATFDASHCGDCPRRGQCPVVQGKKGYYLRYTAKALRLSMRRAREQTDEFKDRYRFRSGVEATMSELDRRTGLKRLRVRGLRAVRYCVRLKAAGLNIFRSAAARKAKNAQDSMLRTGNAFLLSNIFVFKERMGSFWNHIAGEMIFYARAG